MSTDPRQLRVLDLTRVLAGPWCTQMLGDFGADVVKVERPGRGDDARAYGPVFLKDRDGRDTRESPTHLAANRNKRSITLDISQPAGQDLLRRLAVRADVLVENYKVGDLARYGLDQASLAAVNPRLIYCSITGYGQSGPYSSRPGYDYIFQAMSGMMSVTGHPDGEPGAGPLRAGFSVVDVLAGQYACIAILQALYRRDACGGGGQHIDIALFDCAVASLADVTQRYLVSGENPRRLGNGGAAVIPSQLFECRDGSIMIIAGTNAQFRKLCEVLGDPSIADDARFRGVAERSANRQALIARLAGLIRTRGAAELAGQLVAAQVPAGEVNSIAQALDDPQIRHRGLRRELPHPLAGSVSLLANPIRFSDTPAEVYTAPPLLGADTDAVLSEWLQLDASAIETLRTGGIL